MALPVVSRKPWGIVALVLNLILFTPGLGTMVAAARADAIDQFLVGVLQLGLLGLAVALRGASETLGLLVVGIAILWSIAWGVLIFMRSK